MSRRSRKKTLPSDYLDEIITSDGVKVLLPTEEFFLQGRSLEKLIGDTPYPMTRVTPPPPPVKAECPDLTVELEAAKRALAEAKTAQMPAATAKQEQQCLELQTQLAEARASVERQTQEKLTLENEHLLQVSSLQNALDQAQAQIAEFGGQMEQQLSILSEVQASLQTCQQEQSENISKLQAFSQTTQQNQELQSRVAALSNQNTQLSSQLTQLRTSLRQATICCEKGKQFEKEIEGHLEQQKRLRTEIQEIQKTKTESSKEISTLQKNTEKEIADLKLELARVKFRLQTSEAMLEHERKSK